MSRSKQRSHCAHSCAMCDPGKYEAGKAKASDRRRMQDDGEASELSPDSADAQHDIEIGNDAAFEKRKRSPQATSVDNEAKEK